MTLSRPFRPLLLALAVALAGCAHDGKPHFPHAILTPQPGASVPNVALIQGNGKPFRLADLKGHWVWLYLGYTSCPDVCPMAMDYMASEYKKLGRPADLKVVFVSVDPKRDQPAKLKAFAGYYDPAFIGATGDKSALDALAKPLGAAYVFDQPTSSGAYTVSHSNLIFAIDPTGHNVATYVPGTNPGDMANDFKALLAH